MNHRSTGRLMMGLAIYLNLPFALLTVLFSYPQVLRFPAGEILARFHAGGPVLIVVWQAFVLAALALIPLSWMARGASGVATLAGILAGLFQAIGLIRWVFVVPVLATIHAAPDTTEAERAAVIVVFESLHAFAGVAVGEHLGQATTSIWLVLFARALHRCELIPAGQLNVARAAAAMMLIGLTDGFATVLDFNPGMLSLATPVGFITLSVWMFRAGLTLSRHHENFS